MTNEQKIRELKAARGQEFAKGKEARDDKQIQRLHDGINQLKQKVKDG